MSLHTMAAAEEVTTPPVLETLLRAAAAGDAHAFATFAEATLTCAYRLELARAAARGLPASHVRAAAERATRRRYAEARRRVAEQPTSGLSPRAWLLALPLEPGNPA